MQTYLLNDDEVELLKNWNWTEIIEKIRCRNYKYHSTINIVVVISIIIIITEMILKTV